MSLSSIFILDNKGKSLIFRDYRGDMENSCIEKFFRLATEREQEASISPIICDKNVTYVYVRHNDLYFVSLAKCNANAMMILTFLVKLVKILGEYFGAVQEESIRDNFVIVYEILDEIMDFGYPQFTECKILKSYIMQEGQRLEITKPPPAVTNAVSWRSDGIKYKKNEVYIDVYEKINLLVNYQGNILLNDIVGSLIVTCKLSGMPELRLGFNDRLLLKSSGKNSSRCVELEDTKFHQCVRLSSFEKDRTISFIPPDGQFELMTYRMSSSTNPPFWVQSVIERYAGSRVEYLIKIKSQFKSKFVANSVEVRIPVPTDSYSPTYKASLGSCRLQPEDCCIIWSIKSFTGGKECVLRAHVSLSSISADDDEMLKAPIQVKFEILYYTLSGMQIRYLKVYDKSGYKSLPWVRYVSNQGEYDFRTS